MVLEILEKFWIFWVFSKKTIYAAQKDVGRRKLFFLQNFKNFKISQKSLRAFIRHGKAWNHAIRPCRSHTQWKSWDLSFKYYRFFEAFALWKWQNSSKRVPRRTLLGTLVFFSTQSYFVYLVTFYFPVELFVSLPKLF